MINMFKQFLDDKTAYEMYITGVAGTGKTTGLAELVEYCHSNKVTYTVCAFTHKACGILREKLPQDSVVRTLHSYLQKRPTINTDAKHIKELQSNVQVGTPDEVKLLFIDEYSMVGERDLMDIRAEDGLRVVWLGDPHQLPPVGDMQAVSPKGKYCTVLTKIYRNDNPLQEPLQQLISFIEGAKPTPLIENALFKRGYDIVAEYKKSKDDKVMLAYTNRQVQALNAEIMQRDLPLPGDRLFSPTTKHHYTLVDILDKHMVYGIAKAFGDPIMLGSKYRTLEHLLTQDYSYYLVVDDEGQEAVFATVFGHYDFKVRREELSEQAAASNLAIQKKHPEVAKAAIWANQNKATPLAQTRAKAWRSFLSFDECVVCMDFAHAMTVHKSQGSTYNTVFLDTHDLAIAADMDYTQYLKLMYVAVSRASHKVYTT